MTKAKWNLVLGAPYPKLHVDSRPNGVRRFFVWLLLGWRWEKITASKPG